MATRVVLLGPRRDDGFCPARQMTPLDADALRNEGCVQVELAYRGASLRDALTLRMTEEYVARRGKGDPEVAWVYLTAFLDHMHGITALEVATPIPFE